MTALRTRLGAAALGAGLVLATPAAAWATPERPFKDGRRTTSSTAPADDKTTTTTSLAKAARTAPAGQDLETLRKRCLAAVDSRLPALAAAKKVVASVRQLTDDHRAVLTAVLDDTTAALQTVRGQIASDTDADTLRQHCRSVFEDHRVFALVLPRTRLVVAADVAGAVAGKLDELAGKLGTAIAEAEAAGQDMTQAKADLDAMKAKTASARTAAASVADAVLGLSAADWNADHNVLQSARQSLQSARSTLRDARQLAGKIRDELKPGPQADKTDDQSKPNVGAENTHEGSKLKARMGKIGDGLKPESHS